MSDSWDDRRRVIEDEYFERQNKAALDRPKKDKSSRVLPSPITGEPMEAVVLHGIVVDRCQKSGGIWLDAGELEQILEVFKANEKKSPIDFVFELIQLGK